MTYQHGARISEQDSGVRPPQKADLTPVIFGVAPINMVNESNKNVPVLCVEKSDFVDAFGWKADFGDWTLVEAAKVFFDLYRVGPVIFVNVIDPTEADHKDSASEVFDLGTLGSPSYVTAAEFGAIKSTVVVSDGDVTTYTVEDDYTLEFDSDGLLKVNIVPSADGGTIASDLETLTVEYDYLEPTGVDSDDIIGSYAAGVYKGIEVLDQVYPRLGKVPGHVSAPGFNDTQTVMEAMRSKGRGNIAGEFSACSVCDLSTDSGDITDYSTVTTWKTANGYTAEGLVAAWAKIKYGDDLYHLSTHLIALAMLTDVEHDGIPYASPSNKDMVASAMVHDDETEIHLTKAQANVLNGVGVITARRTGSGIRTWGNRTAIYPSETDAKDSFWAVRRMFDYINNTIILTTDRDVDEPGNVKQIEGVVGTIQQWFNGLVKAQALVFGEIKFLEEDNTTSDLSDGKYVYRVTATPPSPARELEFKVRYDSTELAALFS